MTDTQFSPKENNPLLWDTLKELHDTTSKYNLTPSIKKNERLVDYVVTETQHLGNKSISFRVRAIVDEDDKRCLMCPSVVKYYDNVFCSKKCHSEYKINTREELTIDEILDKCITRTPYLPSGDIPNGVPTPHNVSDFVDTWNRISNLSNDDLTTIYDIEHLTNRQVANRKVGMKDLLIKISIWNDSVDDYFKHIISCIKYTGEKTENIEWYSMVYGGTKAIQKMKAKGIRVTGSDNPAYQHGGLFSPFSEKFIKGDISKQTFQKANDSRDRNNTVATRLSYWTERYGEEEGRRLYYDRQNTFNINKLIDKYGEVEGRRRWEERQEKWQHSLSLIPEEKKALIRAHMGFWCYTKPITDLIDPFDTLPTTLYIIEYQPRGHVESYVKVGVTKKTRREIPSSVHQENNQDTRFYAVG